MVLFHVPLTLPPAAFQHHSVISEINSLQSSKAAPQSSIQTAPPSFRGPWPAAEGEGPLKALMEWRRVLNWLTLIKQKWSWEWLLRDDEEFVSDVLHLLRRSVQLVWGSFYQWLHIKMCVFVKQFYNLFFSQSPKIKQKEKQTRVLKRYKGSFRVWRAFLLLIGAVISSLIQDNRSWRDWGV